MLDHDDSSPLRTMRVQRLGGPIGHPDHEGFTVLDDQFREVAPIAAYLDYLVDNGKSPYTVRSYAYALTIYFDYLARRNLKWDDSTKALTTVSQFAGWLRRGDSTVVPLSGGDVRSRRTINHYLTAVYDFYKFQQRHGVHVIECLISESKTNRYKGFLHGLVSNGQPSPLVRLSEPNKRVVDLPLPKAHAVIRAQRTPRDRFLFMLLLFTGMRIGQALGLRHEDIDIEAREIRIVARSNNLNGARAKSVADGEGDVIGRSPMSEELVRAYIDYVQEEAASIGSDYVFTNLRAGVIGAPMTYSNVNDLVRRTRKKVGFHFTVHQFRHTFATQWRLAGLDMEELKELLTHKSIATTIDTYSHLSPDVVRAHLVEHGFLEAGSGLGLVDEPSGPHDSPSGLSERPRASDEG